MANIVYLNVDAERPLIGDDQPWLYVEEMSGRYCGSGGAWKASGEWVGYGSLPEDDVNLDRAVKAAQDWAGRYDIPTIWVFMSH